MNTKSIGNISEVKIISEFVELGIPVLIPFGDNEPYDMVAEVEGKFVTVQVKTGKVENGAIRCTARRKVGSKRTASISYKDLGIDYLAIYCPKNQKSYLVNLQETNVNHEIKLRLEKTKNQKTFVRLAVDYEFGNQMKRIKNNSSKN